ncbi:MAG: hypothetical protein CL920_08255 [Deltaproteobacteria bacterium]|nr:hypothetical protein [Deltaproteobacteria bacterium]MBU48672.1 hypothetical protein [Deltaproteobacteria bacterium]|tara:strand:+ start:3096 stop:4256 length:1161 start_codon:yes stop_codon:yes gene_type:complete
MSEKPFARLRQLDQLTLGDLDLEQLRSIDALLEDRFEDMVDRGLDRHPLVRFAKQHADTIPTNTFTPPTDREEWLDQIDIGDDFEEYDTSSKRYSSYISYIQDESVRAWLLPGLAGFLLLLFVLWVLLKLTDNPKDTHPGQIGVPKQRRSSYQQRQEQVPQPTKRTPKKRRITPKIRKKKTPNVLKKNDVFPKTRKVPLPRKKTIDPLKKWSPKDPPKKIPLFKKQQPIKKFILNKKATYLYLNKRQRAAIQKLAAQAKIHFRKQRAFAQSIKLLYYRRNTDPKGLKRALWRLPFKLISKKTRKRLLNSPLNAVWFGERVPQEAVKWVVYTLMLKGIPVRAIRPFRYPQKRPLDILIGTDVEFNNVPAWTYQQIRKVRKFKRKNPR